MLRQPPRIAPISAVRLLPSGLLVLLSLLASACGGPEADAASDLGTAADASRGSSSRSEPSRSDAPPGIAFSASTVTGGATVVATVTLPFEASRIYVSAPRGALAGPRLVAVPGDGQQVSITFHTNPYLTAPTSVLVSARTGSPDGVSTVFGTLVVLPGAPGVARPEVAGLRFSPDVVAAGATALATLTLTSPAPAGGAAVAVASPDDLAGAVASVPAVVIVPEGSTSVQFAIPTRAPGSWPLGISASYFGGAVAGAFLSVVP
jgi:hypothetical protein